MLLIRKLTLDHCIVKYYNIHNLAVHSVFITSPWSHSADAVFISVSTVSRAPTFFSILTVYIQLYFTILHGSTK